MRTIKFRGYSELKNKWFYGSLVLANSESSSEVKHYSIVSEQGYRYQVIPETVGQFTGLTDKNGKEVYEGDITKYTLEYYDSSKKNLVGTIEFENGAFVITNNKTGFDDVHLWTVYDYELEFEVIGNIHDNPELLK